MRILLAFFLLILPGLADEFLVYAGTYTGHGGKGIYAWRFQSANGKLSALGVVAETGNPSSLVEHPSHRFLYAVNENGGETVLGTVSAYAINSRSGKLSPLNWVSSKGGAPCRLAIDREGKWLAVANCASGGVVVLPILADGRLGEAITASSRPGAHVRDVVFVPDNRFLLAAEEEGIRRYRFDRAQGTLAPEGTTAVSGIARLAFHPDGQVLYALGEKSSTVTAFHYDPHTGAIAEFQKVSTLPEGFAGANTASSLLINSSGKVLYASNRTLNVLAQFAIDGETRALTPMEYPHVMGRSPMQIALDPTGGYLFVANRESGNLTVFRVHPRTGQVQPAGALGKNIPDAACVVFVRTQSGKH